MKNKSKGIIQPRPTCTVTIDWTYTSGEAHRATLNYAEFELHGNLGAVFNPESLKGPIKTEINLYEFSGKAEECIFSRPDLPNRKRAKNKSK